MSKHSISRRQFLLIAGGTTIASSHLVGCHIVARTVLIRIAPRLGKIFSVLLNITDAMLTIDAIIDAVQRTHTENVNHQEVIELRDGARLIIQDGNGKQFLVSFDLLNGNSTLQKNSSYSSSSKNYDRTSTNLRAFVVTRNRSGLHLRSEKSLNSSSIVFAPEGSEVTILYYDQQEDVVNGRLGRWCRAHYNGREGWAWGWYLDVR